METSDNTYKAKGKIGVGVTTTIVKTEESKGLGDTVEKFTKATGLYTLAGMAAKFVGKEDCGCGQRKDKLNNMFPYK
tara:strand:- start:17 stop:247 length:231 start_codon:yes stop_codon:yes gene_type:complete